MSQPTGKRHTLYDQVLEHSRREIDDASAEIEELKRTLALLEARVEASKSVYEAVAARLNLEDEGNLSEPAYADDPGGLSEAAYPEAPPRLEEPEAEDSSSPVDQTSPVVQAPPAPPVLPAASPTAPPEAAPAPARASAPADRPEAEAPPVDGNGTHNDSGGDVSMDLIRRHLEQRASRNQSELQVTPRPAPAIPTPPTLDTTADSISDDDDESSQSGEGESQTAGFPGLSDSDRRLIEEHMRRRAEANQDR